MRAGGKPDRKPNKKQNKGYERPLGGIVVGLFLASDVETVGSLWATPSNYRRNVRKTRYLSFSPGLKLAWCSFTNCAPDGIVGSTCSNKLDQHASRNPTLKAAERETPGIRCVEF